MVRAAPWLAGAHPAGPGGCPGGAGRHLAHRGHAQLCAPGRAGGLCVGLAGCGGRCLPHRPAAPARTRPGLLGVCAGLPAGDDPVGRHRLHLGRSQPGRRLDLARGLPLHGRADGGGGGVVGHAAAAAQGRGGAHQRGAPRPAGLSGRAAGGGGGLQVQRMGRPAAGPRRPRPAARRRQPEPGAAAQVDRPGGPAAGPGLHPAAGGLGGQGGALRDPARAACAATSARPVPGPSSPSSCSTSWATPLPAR